MPIPVDYFSQSTLLRRLLGEEPPQASPLSVAERNRLLCDLSLREQADDFVKSWRLCRDASVRAFSGHLADMTRNNELNLAQKTAGLGEAFDRYCSEIINTLKSADGPSLISATIGADSADPTLRDKWLRILSDPSGYAIAFVDWVVFKLRLVQINAEQPGARSEEPTLRDQGAISSEFRHLGKPNGQLLTATFIANEPELAISKPHLTKSYGEGKALTKRIKVGKEYVYAYKEVAALRHSMDTRATRRY